MSAIRKAPGGIYENFHRSIILFFLKKETLEKNTNIFQQEKAVKMNELHLRMATRMNHTDMLSKG